MPFPVLSAQELQKWAGNCEHAAIDPRITGEERANLLRMKTALLDLAHQQEWLEGNTKETRREDRLPTSDRRVVDRPRSKTGDGA
jgi:hypothetical protein